MVAAERGRIRRQDHKATLLALAAGAFAVFGLIAAAMVTGASAGWDRAVFAQLYSGDSDWYLGPTPGRRNALLQDAVPTLRRVADDRTLALVVGTVVVGLAARHRLRAVAFYLGCIAVAGASLLLKPMFERLSPFPVPGDFAFPSGHAMLSMGMVAGLVLLALGRRWLWPAVLVGALLVGAVAVAVVADGGHWPSDVLAGWMLAAGWSLSLRALVGDPLARKRRG